MTESHGSEWGAPCPSLDWGPHGSALGGRVYFLAMRKGLLCRSVVLEKASWRGHQYQRKPGIPRGCSRVLPGSGQG